MKTKSIPVILMLVAGAMACVLGFIYHYKTTQFFTMVLTVLIVFYVLGCIVKIIIDKNFSGKQSVEEMTVEETEDMKENIDSESEEGDE